MSTLKVGTIQNTSGGASSTPEQIEQGRTKAWLTLNGIGTISIDDSFGISSVSDEGTGKYFVNFSTAFANANYCHAGFCREDFSNDARGQTVVVGARTAPTTGQTRIFSIDTNGSANPRDCGQICIMFAGDV
tara:strand:- start:155 stop:550 length:396 start_codon:yes stop_codon:yes gene_type:complete